MFKGITPLFKQEEKSDLEKLEDECCNELCPKLTYAQRLAGYCACLGVSFALSLGSWTRLVALVHGEPVGFVAFYTLSNVVGIGGSSLGPAFLYEALKATLTPLAKQPLDGDRRLALRLALHLMEKPSRFALV